MTGETYQERWNAALMNNYGTPALELVKRQRGRGCGTPTAAATWTWSAGSR